MAAIRCRRCCTLISYDTARARPYAIAIPPAPASQTLGRCSRILSTDSFQLARLKCINSVQMPTAPRTVRGSSTATRSAFVREARAIKCDSLQYRQSSKQRCFDRSLGAKRRCRKKPEEKKPREQCRNWIKDRSIHWRQPRQSTLSQLLFGVPAFRTPLKLLGRARAAIQ